MRRMLALAGFLGMLVVAPLSARAHDAYDDSQSHPLRLVAYAVHPVGYFLEWTIFRPVHFLVSQRNTERVFGHTPHDSPFGGYQAYLPSDTPVDDRGF